MTSYKLKEICDQQQTSITKESVDDVGEQIQESRIDKFRKMRQKIDNTPGLVGELEALDFKPSRERLNAIEKNAMRWMVFKTPT
jgi:hypothetical protein